MWVIVAMRERRREETDGGRTRITYVSRYVSRLEISESRNPETRRPELSIDGIETSQTVSEALVFDLEQDRELIETLFRVSTSHDYDRRDSYFMGVEIRPAVLDSFREPSRYGRYFNIEDALPRGYFDD